MKDVQKERDLRNIAIDRVGVRDVNYPITVMDSLNGMQAIIASVSMSVLLPHEYRGTHMSRFIETLEEYGPARHRLGASGLLDRAPAHRRRQRDRKSVV